jgi:hypothetical protein
MALVHINYVRTLRSVTGKPVLFSINNLGNIRLMQLFWRVSPSSINYIKYRMTYV